MAVNENVIYSKRLFLKLKKMLLAFSNHNEVLLADAEYFSRLYKRHVQGALVRSGASLFMWIVACLSLFFEAIQTVHFKGVSISIIFLILINPPTLWVLKRLTDRRLIEFFSLLINGLEILGYTSIIYLLGGMEAAYLTPIYAALIVYVGVVAPKKVTFIITLMCAVFFSSIVLLEYFGVLPHFATFKRPQLPFVNQITQLFAINAMLFVVGFISSYTAQIIRQTKIRLREQNIKLEKASQAKSVFLANMSHELRTPLNHIIGFTELVVDKNFGDLNEDQAEYLQDVLHSSRHLLELINDILDLSKVEAGKLELQPTPVKLRELLENSLIMVKEKALKHRIKLSHSSNGIPIMITADERKLKQIIYNLLSNAVKFTPDGGQVTISAQRYNNRNQKVYAVDNGESGSVMISISDTGIGINSNDLQRIFKPFDQVETSRSRKFQGTGLGLSLTKSLVELHGGKIWAESEGEGKGSTFSFTLPITLIEVPSGSEAEDTYGE